MPHNQSHLEIYKWQMPFVVDRLQKYPEFLTPSLSVYFAMYLYRSSHHEEYFSSILIAVLTL